MAYILLASRNCGRGKVKTKHAPEEMEMRGLVTTLSFPKRDGFWACKSELIAVV